MADLNVSLVLRLVDRMSGPAQAAQRSLTGLANSGRGFGAAGKVAAANAERLARAAGRFSGDARGMTAGASRAAGATNGVAAAAARATGAIGAMGGAGAGAAVGFGRIASAAAAVTTAADTSSRALADASGAAIGLGHAATKAAGAEERLTGRMSRSGAAAVVAGERLSTFERLQRRASATSKLFGGELDRLDRRLGTFARAAIVTDAIGRGASAITSPFERSVSAAAKWQRSMIGVGITAGLTQQELAETARQVFATAQKYGVGLDYTLGIQGAVLNEGAYRKKREQAIATDAVTGLSLVARVMGDPISPMEAGAMTNAYAYSLNIPAEQIDRANAMMYKGAVLGGTRLGTMARFMPSVMGGLKAAGDGNMQGFASAIAAFQIAKRRAGTDDEAAVFVRDLINDANQAHTISRFKKLGIDLPGMIEASQRRGGTAIEGIVEAARKVVGSATGEEREKRFKGVFINQYSGGALSAIMDNYEDRGDLIGYKTLVRQALTKETLNEYFDKRRQASSGMAAEETRAANAKQDLAITTGTNLAPASNAVNRAKQAIADSANSAQRASGVAGQAAVIGAAALGYTGRTIGQIGQAAVTVGGLGLAVQSFHRPAPLAFRGGLARAAAAASKIRLPGGLATAAEGGAAAAEVAGGTAAAAEVAGGTSAAAEVAGGATAIGAGAAAAPALGLGALAALVGGAHYFSRLPMERAAMRYDFARLTGNRRGIEAEDAWMRTHDLVGRPRYGPTPPTAARVGGSAEAEALPQVSTAARRVADELTAAARQLAADATAIGAHARAMASLAVEERSMAGLLRGAGPAPAGAPGSRRDRALHDGPNG